jgi:hypothetical protein
MKTRMSEAATQTYGSADTARASFSKSAYVLYVSSKLTASSALSTARLLIASSKLISRIDRDSITLVFESARCFTVAAYNVAALGFGESTDSCSTDVIATWGFKET